MMPTQTSLPALLQDVHALSRRDKLRLLQFLAVELAREEGAPTLAADTSYSIWTPYNAFDAAAVMLLELEKEPASP